MVFQFDIIEDKLADSSATSDVYRFHRVDILMAVEMLDGKISYNRILLNIDKGEMVICILAHMDLLNWQTLRLGGMDVAEGDSVKGTRGLARIKLGKADTILIVSTENVRDSDILDLVIDSEKTRGTVTAFSENAIDFDIGDVAT
jgi:hypothetical protein